MINPDYRLYFSLQKSNKPMHKIPCASAYFLCPCPTTGFYLSSFIRALYFGGCFFFNRNSSLVSDITIATKITANPSNSRAVTASAPTIIEKITPNTDSRLRIRQTAMCTSAHKSASAEHRLWQTRTDSPD